MWAADVYRALLLTLIGALGTSLGGLLVCLTPNVDYARLGKMQGIAAGLMLTLTFCDLLPEAVETIGFAWAQARSPGAPLGGVFQP